MRPHGSPSWAPGRPARSPPPCCSAAAGPEVDLFERLPTPWGLLRGGVAPDHHEIKRLDQLFDRQVFRRPRCRFFGNVEVGNDLSHADLMSHYTAVVYAVGAQTDKSLGIPGEDLPGSLPATDFVGWYNGHPDRRELEPDLSGKRAVIIGNGNVAADVARMLTLGADELQATDTADHALDALRESAIEEVVVLGRRGPAQAAFTSAELRELGQPGGSGAAWSTPPRRSSIRSRRSGWPRRAPSPHARTSSCCGSSQRASSRARRGGESSCDSSAHPWRSSARTGWRACGSRPTGSLVTTRARCAPARWRGRPRTSSARWCSGRWATRPSLSPTCPSTSAATCCPNEQGRVVDAGSGRATARGLRGGLDQARADRHPRHQQARRRGDHRLPGGRPGGGRCSSRRRRRSTRCWRRRRPARSSLEGWRAIDELEQQRGRDADRPRVKLASREELLAAAE